MARNANLENWRFWITEPAPGRDFIQKCSKQAKPGSHQIHPLLGSPELCWAHGVVPIFYGTGIDFTVEPKPNGRLHVTMPVSLELAEDFNKSEEEEFDAWWTQNTQCMKDFWSRYGVDLELELAGDATTIFAIHSGPGRSDSSNLYWKEGTTIKLHPCTALIHEFGHRLGLPDRYIETGVNCPKRDPRLPDKYWEVMAMGAASNPGYAQFSQDDLVAIFGSLCPDVH